MRPIHVSVIAGLSLATLGVTQAEIEGELTGTIHAGLSSEYIFRGVDQGGGSMVEAGLSWGGLSFWGITWNSSLWYASVGNGGSKPPSVIDSAGNEYHYNRGSFDELDYQSGLSYDFGFLEAEVGQILYNFPGGKTAFSSAQELYFKVSRTQWETDFAATYYWDIDEDNDGYSELTIDRDFPINECLSIGAGGTISYDWESGDMHHYGLSASLNWAYNDVLTISPYVSATFAEDGAKDKYYYPVVNPGFDPGYFTVGGDELFGGIILSASF